MLEKTDVIAVVLAGGAGRRFDGQDKGLLDWHGRSLIEHVLDAVSPQVAQVVISANRHTDRYKEFGHTVLSDESEGFAGPLAGIAAAINFVSRSASQVRTQPTSYQALLVSTCDSPSLPADYLQILIKHLESAAVAVVHDGQRRQNLHCLIRRDAWPSLLHFFEQGGRAMHRWFEGIELAEADFSDQAEKFSNINSPTQVSTQ